MGRRSPFTKTQKRDAVLAVLAGKQTVSEVCRELGISAQTFTRWRSAALTGLEDALADKDDRNRREAELERKLDDAERTIGRLALENDLLGKAPRRLT
jgi:transposase-like protein